jgi:hypothetical protein
MENKYYTPTIEEFHVGFEYEQLNQVSQVEDMERKYNGQMIFGDSYTHVPKPSVWDIKTCDTYTNLPYIKTWAKTEFRVKYLDREDIESFGFEEVPNVPIDWFEKDDWRLYKQGTEVSIKKAGEGFNIHFGIFEGVIKNKSELKKVLKMIGYE